MSIKILPIVDICKLVCHTLGMARFSVKTEASERLQDIFTKNVRVRMALYDIKQGTLAEALHLTQATLSTKLNRRVEWTVADIANAAVFFKEPVENLVSDSAIEAISGGSEYQLPHYAAVDISRREKGETSWREASCFDSGDVKHEAERKNRVDGGGRSGVVQGAGGGSCERFRDRGDQRGLRISTGALCAS